VRSRRGWIFDLDGTLTVAIHDFDAIRTELGIASGLPILEALAEMPSEHAAPLHARLDAIELEIARQAQPAAGAQRLLDRLQERGTRIGIVTRNTRDNALETLASAGLGEYFDADDIVSREHAAPKPSPAGILQLLERWECRAAEAVMLGDFLYDLEAGRAAGTATVYVDVADSRR
jgi:HAD superfamily hydrolase (TIGR01509 family)